MPELCSVHCFLYALLGGADYGGGVWDLFAFGKRKKDQRKLIEDAIGPVWEANHVWLILVVVVLFTAFPQAFSTISTALHIPLSLLLIGIILRGTSFVFRKHDTENENLRSRWSLIFSISSIITPVLLGITLGAIASGTIRVENGVVQTDFFSSWLAPFPFAVGFFALALFAFLAAVYLTLETENRELQEDFRKRAHRVGNCRRRSGVDCFPACRKRCADGSRRNQPHFLGFGLAYFNGDFCHRRVLCFVDAKISTCTIFRGGAGYDDSARLGSRAISLFGRTGYYDL